MMDLLQAIHEVTKLPIDDKKYHFEPIDQKTKKKEQYQIRPRLIGAGAALIDLENNEEAALYEDGDLWEIPSSPMGSMYRCSNEEIAVRVKERQELAKKEENAARVKERREFEKEKKIAARVKERQELAKKEKILKESKYPYCEEIAARVKERDELAKQTKILKEQAKKKRSKSDSQEPTVSPTIDVFKKKFSRNAAFLGLLKSNRITPENLSIDLDQLEKSHGSMGSYKDRANHSADRSI